MPGFFENVEGQGAQDETKLRVTIIQLSHLKDNTMGNLCKQCSEPSKANPSTDLAPLVAEHEMPVLSHQLHSCIPQDSPLLQRHLVTSEIPASQLESLPQLSMMSSLPVTAGAPPFRQDQRNGRQKKNRNYDKQKHEIDSKRANQDINVHLTAQKQLHTANGERKGGFNGQEQAAGEQEQLRKTVW